MIQIISGEKVKEDKILIEKQMQKLRQQMVTLFILTKSNKHMYELHNRIRLINVKDHFITNHSEFLGLSMASFPVIMIFKLYFLIVSLK